MPEILREQIVSKAKLELKRLVLHRHAACVVIPACAERQRGYRNFGLDTSQAHAVLTGVTEEREYNEEWDELINLSP